MTWTAYPNDKGHFATAGDMILNAFEDGAWAVWKSGSGAIIPPMSSSEQWPRKSTNLSEAKAAAEAALEQMMDGNG